MHPANATDRMVQPPSVQYTPRDGYWCVRTPERPDYLCGNFLLVEDDYRPGAIRRWLAWWRQELADAAQKVLILWETELDAAPADAYMAQEAGELGLSARKLSVLQVQGEDLRAPPRAASWQPRPARTDDDWAQVLALAIEELEGDEPGYADFARWRQAGYRALAERGRGQWWGVWDGALLVGSAGFFESDEQGRFQEVVTRASHRRQGVCFHLCHAILGDFFARRPGGSAVIVAHDGSQADSIYRRLGFGPTHVQWELSAKLT